MRAASVESLIDGLAEGLRPVRRLRAPWLRAFGWIVAVACAAAVLAAFSDLREMAERFRAAPDLWIAALGSTLTAILGAAATFELSLPDRPRTWALLPVPGLALWIAATGMGCLRSWIVPGGEVANLDDARTCFAFILLVSLPLSGLTLVMIRRACPLRPNLAAATGGIAVAAAAATLLLFFHPYDVGATDIAVHLAAFGLVIGANRLVGGRLLTSA